MQEKKAAGKEAVGFVGCNVGVVDGEAEFEEAVEAVLETFEQGGNAAETLTRIPDFSAESAETPWPTIQARLRAAVTEYVKATLQERRRSIWQCLCGGHVSYQWQFCSKHGVEQQDFPQSFTSMLSTH